MRYIKLRVWEDRAIGELGLLVEGVRLLEMPMVATRGLIIAHDLLEHQNGLGAIGSIDDELEALGGVWFVRGQSGYMEQESGVFYRPPWETLAYEIANLGRYYVLHDIDMKTPVPRTLHTYETEEFPFIVEEGRSKLQDELDHDPCDEEDLEYQTTRTRDFIEQSLHYMRRGYSKAKRRYRDNDNKARTQFWAISDAVDKIIPWVEWEGQTFLLSYGMGEANVKMVEDNDYED